MLPATLSVLLFLSALRAPTPKYSAGGVAGADFGLAASTLGDA